MLLDLLRESHKRMSDSSYNLQLRTKLGTVLQAVEKAITLPLPLTK